MASSNSMDVKTGFSPRALIRQLRPKQWAKNGIVLLPLLFSGNLKSLDLLIQAILCTVAFCAISSAVYTINDLFDIKADQAHPTKCRRPLASGQITQGQAVALVTFLVIGGLLCAFIVRPTIDLIILIYLAMNLSYSFKLKTIPIVDILCIAMGFVLRACGGSLAVHVVPSAWFLMCTTFGALFLGLEKRRYELVLLAGKSGEHRAVLQKYTLPLIARLESLIAPSLLMTYALYTFQATTSHGQWMTATIPIVLYGVMRYQFISEKGECTGTPEDILFKDRSVQVTILLWLATCALVVYGNPHAWLGYLVQTLDSLRI